MHCIHSSTRIVQKPLGMTECRVVQAVESRHAWVTHRVGPVGMWCDWCRKGTLLDPTVAVGEGLQCPSPNFRCLISKMRVFVDC